MKRYCEVAGEVWAAVVANSLPRLTLPNPVWQLRWAAECRVPVA